MSGGGGSTNTVQKADPWGPSQPYLEEGFEAAQQGVLNQPSVVPFSPETQFGLNQTANRALQGSPLLGEAQQQISDTLGGDYMAGGPGFDAFADSAWSSVRPNVDSAFAGAGRYGSALHGEALGRGFGRAMAPLYNAERQRQMGAAGMAPGLADADYMDYARLMGVGAAREGKLQEYADEPYERVAKYMGLITPGAGMGQTVTQSGGQGSSPLLGALGGGMSGAGLASGLMGAGAMNSWNPYGWALMGGGALLGGLSS